MAKTSLAAGLFSNPLSRSASSENTVPESSPLEKIISLEEVSWHDQPKDCWVVVYDRVYDVTDFLEKHPGGADLILEYAGRDATGAFRSSGHSSTAFKTLTAFFLGELPLPERIFRKTGGFRLSDMPD